jgi:hypothetical protein
MELTNERSGWKRRRRREGSRKREGGRKEREPTSQILVMRNHQPLLGDIQYITKFLSKLHRRISIIEIFEGFSKGLLFGVPLVDEEEGTDGVRGGLGEQVLGGSGSL